MKSTPLETWQKLAAAARAAGEQASPGADETPPLGFATRVVAQWRAQQRERALNLWSRWSLATALGSAAACAVLSLAPPHTPDPAEALILPPPPSDSLLPALPPAP
jgi:hypothetical protein